jgi:hypothetical protein
MLAKNRTLEGGGSRQAAAPSQPRPHLHDDVLHREICSDNAHGAQKPLLSLLLLLPLGPMLLLPLAALLLLQALALSRRRVGCCGIVVAG